MTEILYTVSKPRIPLHHHRINPRNGGAYLDQIKASLGHASVQTTERYVGETQRFTDAPADRLGLRLRSE